MKGFGLKGSLALLAMTFFLLLGPGRGQAQEEVIIQVSKGRAYRGTHRDDLDGASPLPSTEPKDVYRVRRNP